MYLLLALMLIPIVEIALFIKIGGLIGLGWTLAIVVGTAVLGSYLIRRQGTQALQALRQRVSTFSDPTGPLFDGVAILVAGIFLLTPGFLTDTLGLLLLIPAVRRFLFQMVRARVTIVSSGLGVSPGSGSVGPGQVIEGEFEEIGSRPPRH
jgi:UPF0716 protein FxsA